MALRADLIVIKVQQHSSGSVNEVIAESTDVTFSFSAEALESTSQTSGLNATFEGGKVTGTASGSYLVASNGDQFTNLFAHMNSATKVAVEGYRNNTKYIECDGVITSLEESGGLSDALATGSYTIQLSGNPAV
jgi:hypothetical protein